jgi:hypothetical protein
MGQGANEMVIIPFRGHASARMMAVYFPQKKLLYCSDMYLPKQWGGDYWVEHLSEIRDLIAREHLQVERVLGLHMQPIAWSELSSQIPLAGQ